MGGDKEIAVRIRSNSHCRIAGRFAALLSRNACRPVRDKCLLGKEKTGFAKEQARHRRFSGRGSLSLSFCMKMKG